MLIFVTYKPLIFVLQFYGSKRRFDQESEIDTIRQHIVLATTLIMHLIMMSQIRLYWGVFEHCIYDSWTLLVFYDFIFLCLG